MPTCKHNTRMRRAMRASTPMILLCLAFTMHARASGGPQALALPAPIPSPRDTPYRGKLRLLIDATDTRHKVLVVHESIPVAHAGEMVLLYPAWEAASHAQTVAVQRLAALTLHAGTQRLAWRRDPVDIHAFHVRIPAGVRTLEVDFQYLSPATAREGALDMTSDIVALHWQDAVVYPAGWYARDITVEPTLRLPAGFGVGTSLEPRERKGLDTTFRPVSLETLVDSPVLAGRWFLRTRIRAGQRPVFVDLVADSQADLAFSGEQQSGLRALDAETEAVFGAVPYPHYDFLVSLSDKLPAVGGTEHAASSEVNLTANGFARAPSRLDEPDLIAHEYAHAWNGLDRTPADLWTPNFNVPMRDSLLWMYEGQTEFWGRVLAARSGQRSVEETLAVLAVDAAVASTRSGRSWKSLGDSNNDPLSMAGRPVAWRDWQRREDYYGEGVLLWLAVDAVMRNRTHGLRGIDDFALRFFAPHANRQAPLTYTGADVFSALDAVVPFDWRTFVSHRLETHDDQGLLDGLTQAGYRLVFTETPTDYFKFLEADDGVSDFGYSIGLAVTQAGVVRRVSWNSAAFRAGITIGSKIVSIDGTPFTPDLLAHAVQQAPTDGLALVVETDGSSESLRVDARAGLRYPRLERIPGTPDGLARLLTARRAS